MAALQNNREEPGGTQALVPDAGEELALLHRQIDSFALRGDYPACAAAIESNLGFLYERERWPEDFFAVLQIYRRCYPSLGKSNPFDECLTELLEKNGIPFIFVNLLRGSGSSTIWSADYFKNLAVLAESKESFEAALAYSDLALKIDPANSPAHVVRGWILDDMDRPDEAENMYVRALELNEANHRAANSLAKHLTVKNPQLALEYIDKAIELSPSESSYYGTKAQILARIGDRAGALACYDLAASHSPYTADYPYQKGEIMLAEGREMSAITQYHKAMALDEKHLPSLWRLAALYQESQPDLALAYANTIASLDPDNPETGLLRGKLLGRLDNGDEAASQFRRLLDADPKYHEALAGYAEILSRDDPEAAIDHYSQAISLAPGNAAYRTGRARAYEQLGKTALAVKDYRAAVSLDKTDAKSFERLGSLLAEQKPREALEYFNKAIGLEPDNAFCYASKGQILMKLPNGKNEAAACFAAALKHDPNNAPLHICLAKLLEETGNAAVAAEHYKRAVGIGTDDPDVFYRLARLTLSTEPDVALLHINSAISFDKDNGEYYYFKAKVLDILGHDRQALAQLRNSLNADGKNAETLSEISGLTAENSPREALAYMNRAIEMYPDNPDYLCSRANLFFELGEYEKALAEYRNALKRDAKHHESLYGCGRCLAAKGDAKALEYFDKAISLNGSTAAYHAEKAAFLAGLGRIGEALSAYGKAVPLDSKNHEYVLAEAKLIEQNGDASAAAESYRKVLAIQPDCPKAIGRLGILLAEQSSPDALLYLDRAIELFPDEYLYHAWRGSALLSAGDSKGAADEYRRSAMLGGETAETYYTIAQILCEKLPETALGYCLRAVGKNGGVAAYHLLCGKLRLALEHTGDAIDSFATAARLDPKCHEAAEKVAEILSGRNSPDTLDAVNNALKSDPACAACLMLKARLLDESGDTDGAVACLDLTLKASPGSVAAREELVLLLQKKRSLVRLQIEKRRLEAARRRASKQKNQEG